jgi:hypothetical protein
MDPNTSSVSVELYSNSPQPHHSGGAVDWVVV